MNLDALKQKVAGLEAQQRRRLAASLVFSDMTPEEKANLRRKMDDKDPSRWLTLEEAKARLENIPEPPDE